MKHNLVIPIARECELARFDFEVPPVHVDRRWAQGRTFDRGERIDRKINDFDRGFS
jgi:hypothetical protein